MKTVHDKFKKGKVSKRFRANGWQKSFGASLRCLITFTPGWKVMNEVIDIVDSIGSKEKR